MYATAHDNEGITGLLEVTDSGRFTRLHAIADESEESLGFLR